MINRFDQNGNTVDVLESNGKQKHSVQFELDYLSNTVDNLIKQFENLFKIIDLKNLKKDIESLRGSVNLYDKTMEFVKEINDVPPENLSLMMQHMSTVGGEKLDSLSKKGALLDLDNDNTTTVVTKQKTKSITTSSPKKSSPKKKKTKKSNKNK